jgi:PAS domain S-box-containing protein
MASQQPVAELKKELEIAQKRIQVLEDLLSKEARHEDPLQYRLVQRLEGLHRLDHVLLSADSLENLAEIALLHVRKLIPCFRASITTVNIEAKTAYVLALYSENVTATSARQTYPIDDTYFTALIDQTHLIVDDLEESANPSIQQLYKEGVRTIMLVPLRANGHLIGLLNLHSVQTNYFTEEIVDIALEIAAQLAIGIQKATFADALVHYAQRMEILHTLDLALIQGGSTKRLIAKTFQQLRRVIPCERIGLGVIEPDVKHVVIYTSDFDYESELNEGTRIPIPPQWFEGFSASGNRLVNNLALIDEPTYQRLAKEGFQSQFQVLLRAETGNIGIIGFSSTVLNFFTTEYQQIATEVSNQLAIALHQMQLNEALERYAAELEQRVIERTAELQEAKNQLETILQNSLDGILLVDKDLRIQHANPAVNRLLSVELNLRQEVVNLLDLLHPDDAMQIRARVEQALVAEIPLQVEARSRHRSKEDQHMELSFGSIPGDGLVSTIHDITARKQAEAVLQKALDKEKEVAEAKSRFVSIASHEFRTPLTAISMAAESLFAYLERLSREQIDRKLSMIRDNVLFMTAIMDDVLQLAKVQSSHLEVKPRLSDLDTLCQAVIEEFSSHSDEQNRITYTSNRSPLNAVFDERLMRQAITNLISNALKYSSNDKPIRISLAGTSSEILFSITDEGIGIPASDLERLFEPFHRGGNTETIKGTGLGLSITKQIIELHRGQLRVDSQVGNGTTFTIAIPVSTG